MPKLKHKLFVLQGRKGKSGARGTSGTKGPPVSWMHVLVWHIKPQSNLMLLYKISESSHVNIYEVVLCLLRVHRALLDQGELWEGKDLRARLAWMDRLVKMELQE